MEEFMSAATAKGMVLVDADGFGDLKKEYEKVLKTVDELCDLIDPETTPYKSKYEARKMLDTISNQLEAARTVAMLEKKVEIIENADWRLGVVRVRLGIISWEVEEPHNAQTELELAAHYYLPGFVEEVAVRTADEDDDESKAEVSPETSADIESLVPALENIPEPSSFSAFAVRVDTMKCLNMLGILWAGRARVKKSFVYLMAAKSLYHAIKDIAPVTALEAEKKKELESAYTHTLFYLAQAYGHIGDAANSCKYCFDTLQRQFSQGLADHKQKMEWAKNCSALADFFLSSQLYRKTSKTLTSAESILNGVLADLASDASSSSSSSSSSSTATSQTRQDCVELLADVHRRMVRLDVIILKRAFDRMMHVQNCAAAGELFEEEVDVELAMAAETATSVFAFETASSSQSLFEGVPCSEAPLLAVGEVSTFEQARVVFLRALTRIESIKKVYPLDGCVTDHVNILLDNSKLYHYLSLFEPDAKRKIAMETRRIEMLQPLLESLSKSSFEALHKTIAYEVGETYLSLLENKLEKLKARHVAVTGSDSGFSERSMKKVEVQKCNEYCRGALICFAHFTHLYAKTGPRQELGSMNSPFQHMNLVQIKDAACIDPDLSQITDEEIRPFLNAHFLSCRALSKVIPASDAPAKDRSQWLVAAQQRYLWLSRFGRELCLKKGVNLEDVFHLELSVCDDMSQLLPSKIDRMHFLGESGLSL